MFIHINKTGGTSVGDALKIPFEHLTAREKRLELGAARYDARFRFAFVRNPWDKVVSHYAYRVKTNQTALRDRGLDFREWVLRAYGDRDPEFHDQPKMFQPQVDWINDADGNSLVDFVGRFERLNDDFTEVCRQIGVDAELPHLKSSSHRDFRSYYDDETSALIGDRFQEDIITFGYDFGAQ